MTLAWQSLHPEQETWYNIQKKYYGLSYLKWQVCLNPQSTQICYSCCQKNCCSCHNTSHTVNIFKVYKIDKSRKYWKDVLLISRLFLIISECSTFCMFFVWLCFIFMYSEGVWNSWEELEERKQKARQLLWMLLKYFC